MFFFDPVYLLFVFLPGLLLGLWAQAKVKKAYHEASKQQARSGLTGAQAAAEILQADGIDDVKIEQSRGWLSDHYDPRHRVLRLSPDVYSGRNLAALGIAAHEAGHAIQHARNYAPLTARNAIVPFAGIGTNLGIILVIAGLFLQMFSLAIVGVALFALTVVFQLVNLPCEFNASSRARERLLALGMVSEVEDGTVKKVLNAAALTYVAALITAVLNLLYYLMIALSARE